MILSVSTLIIGSGAATPVRVVNLSIAILDSRRGIVKPRQDFRQARLALGVVRPHIGGMSDSTRRPEAEIIPPGAADPTKWRDRRGDDGGNARVWVWSSGPNGQRLRYGRPGPLGLIVLFAGL